MKIPVDKRLFWFLRENASLDLSDPATLEMYVQQIITRGRTEDIQRLLKTLGIEELKRVFQRIQSFLGADIKRFWEDLFADH